MLALQNIFSNKGQSQTDRYTIHNQLNINHHRQQKILSKQNKTNTTEHTNVKYNHKIQKYQCKIVSHHTKHRSYNYIKYDDKLKHVHVTIKRINLLILKSNIVSNNLKELGLIKKADCYNDYT